jgi:hypothetical protein
MTMKCRPLGSVNWLTRCSNPRGCARSAGRPRAGGGGGGGGPPRRGAPRAGGAPPPPPSRSRFGGGAAGHGCGGGRGGAPVTPGRTIRGAGYAAPRAGGAASSAEDAAAPCMRPRLLTRGGGGVPSLLALAGVPPSRVRRPRLDCRRTSRALLAFRAASMVHESSDRGPATKTRGAGFQKVVTQARMYCVDDWAQPAPLKARKSAQIHTSCVPGVLPPA